MTSDVRDTDTKFAISVSAVNKIVKALRQTTSVDVMFTVETMSSRVQFRSIENTLLNTMMDETTDDYKRFA